MRRILVTGGAGFIGSWICRNLLNNHPDCEVINLDSLTYAGNLDNLADITANPRYQFIHGDIRDRETVRQAMQGAYGCIHAAAETHVDRSITEPAVFVETNVLGTQVLLDAAREAEIDRFVQVSTDEVYGSLPLEIPEKFMESSPINPSSPYAASKASADLLAKSAYKTHGLPVSITRCGNNYGPYQYPEKLIPFFILHLLEGKPVPVYGDGKNVRDWIHVSDHAEAVIRVFFSGGAGEIYNIGANNEQSNLAITQLLLKLMNQPQDNLEFVNDRPAHDRRYALFTQKIRNTLSWQPKIDFETGLRDTVAWYQKNTAWIESVQARQAREKTAPGAAWLVSS